MEAGLNLYSLRTEIQSEEAFLSTALKLRDMGYSTLQYSGGPYDPAMLARISEKTGLPIVLTHVPMDRILNDTEALMNEHKSFGCKYIGLGEMPFEIILDAKTCLNTIDALEVAAQRMQARGFTLFYHNHHFEFFHIGNKTVFDILIERAPHIHFTVDTYWLQFGGVDVLRFLEKLNGRIECVHLKDYLIDRSDSDIFPLMPRFAPVGDGTLDFHAIVDKAKQMGAVHFLVEQDNAPDFPDPFAQVKRSIEYIKKEF